MVERDRLREVIVLRRGMLKESTMLVDIKLTEILQNRRDILSLLYGYFHSVVVHRYVINMSVRKISFLIAFSKLLFAASGAYRVR